MNNKRIILHVDLNSFFAMAEQQANPVLRGKPVGIVKASGRTCIIAASVEAKKYGLTTGCRVNDAKKLCPQIILVPADFDKYEDLSLRFINLCRQFSDSCEVFSLDECFLDATESQKFFLKSLKNISLDQKAWQELAKLYGPAFLGAVNMAFEIKKGLRNIGDFLTCSIGISHNRMLAKLASSQIKPDGLFFINDENKLRVLDQSNLTDVCGLGFGLYKHLKALGINSFEQIRSLPFSYLHDNFGPFWSVHLYNISRGEDDSRLTHFTQIAEAKSVGRTYTTHKLLNNKNEVYRLARNLSEEACAKARKMGLCGRYVGFCLRTSPRNWSGLNNEKNSQSWYGHRTLKNYIDDGKKLFDICRLISEDWELKNIIFCGVTFGMLTRKQNLPLPLFFDDKRRQDLVEANDNINARFGDYTLFPGQLLGMDIIRPEVTGYFGDKFYRLKSLYL